MKTNGHISKKKTAKIPMFVVRAERAFRRVAIQVRAEHTRLDLPLIGAGKIKARANTAQKS